MRDEPTASVELSLEETGTLCHLIMGQEEVRKAIMSGKATPPIARVITLYNKLANANDKLMGKNMKKIVGYQIKTHKQIHKFKGHKRKPVDKKWNELINDQRLAGETIALHYVYGDGSTELAKVRTMDAKKKS